MQSLFKRTFILSYIKQFKLVKGDKKFYPKYTDTYSDKAQFV